VNGLPRVMLPHYDADMRTTIDLPDDLHRIASSIARDQGTTLSAAVADLLRRALGQGRSSGPEVVADPDTGMRVLRLGYPVTIDDVRALDDEE